jgi:ankyrin repeat protein
VEIEPEIVKSFMDAAVSDHLGAEAILRDHPNLVNARVLWGETCLHYLATEGFADGVRFLAKHGFDVNAANEYGDRPLLDAARNAGKTPGCRAVVLALLELGANPNAPGSNDLTPLLAVVENSDIELALALLNHGADPNQADEYWGPPLFFAVKARHADLVALLLERGATPNYKTTFGDDVSIVLHDEDESIRQSLIKFGWCEK